MMTNGQFLPHPLDTHIGAWLIKATATWAKVAGDLTSAQEEALERLISAGLVEARLRASARMDGSPVEVIALCRVSGDYRETMIYQLVLAGPDWVDADGRTKAGVQTVLENYLTARLTADGEYAKGLLEAGSIGELLRYVRGGDGQESYRQRPAVIIEDISQRPADTLPQDSNTVGNHPAPADAAAIEETADGLSQGDGDAAGWWLLFRPSGAACIVDSGGSPTQPPDWTPFHFIDCATEAELSGILSALEGEPSFRRVEADDFHPTFDPTPAAYEFPAYEFRGLRDDEARKDAGGYLRLVRDYRALDLTDKEVQSIRTAAGELDGAMRSHGRQPAPADAAALEETADGLPQGDGGAVPEASKPRRRRRKGNKEPRPLTPNQAEVVQIVGECKGNIAEAARRLGKDRKTVAESYRVAMEKLGKQAVKHQTKRLSTDRRGQENLSPDDDRRG